MRLVDAYRRMERLDEGEALMRGYLEHYSSLYLLDVVIQLLLEKEGSDSAYRLVRDELQRNPTLMGLERLMNARLVIVAPEVRPDIELARTIVQGYTCLLYTSRCV